MSIPQTDVVDCFLKTLGGALCRLPYRKILEIKFLQMVLEAETE